MRYAVAGSPSRTMRPGCWCDCEVVRTPAWLQYPEPGILGRPPATRAPPPSHPTPSSPPQEPPAPPVRCHHSRRQSKRLGTPFLTQRKASLPPNRTPPTQPIRHTPPFRLLREPASGDAGRDCCGGDLAARCLLPAAPSITALPRLPWLPRLPARVGGPVHCGAATRVARRSHYRELQRPAMDNP